MSSIEKLKKRFYAKDVPVDMTTDEILRLANHYDCKVLYGGNHQIRIANIKTGMVVPLPQHGKTVKPPYIRELRTLFGDHWEE